MCCVHSTLTDVSVDIDGCTIVAVFGLPPSSHSDDPARSLLAASQIRAQLAAQQLTCAMGLGSGAVYCGVLGGEGRKVYALAGEPVDLAQVLMQQAKTNKSVKKKSADLRCFNSRLCLHQCHVVHDFIPVSLC